MGKLNFSQIVSSVKTSISNHSPEILMGIGIAGMLTAGVLAVKATPKALKLLEEKKEEKHVDKLKPVDVVKTTWKCYIPSVVTAGVSTVCLIGSARENLRRNAALATAYKLSESAFSNYREKVIETIGEKKEQTVRETITKEKLEQNPVSKNDVIMIGNGTTLCYDDYSGRYFMSDMETLRKAENNLNRRMRYVDYISLNEFYSEIGLPCLYPLGDDLGWNIDKGYIEIHFDTQLSDDGRPALVVEFTLAPVRGYSKYN